MKKLSLLLLTLFLVGCTTRWERVRDVYAFWNNRKNILALRDMTYFKYIKLLFQGLRAKRNMKEF